MCSIRSFVFVIYKELVKNDIELFVFRLVLQWMSCHEIQIDMHLVKWHNQDDRGAALELAIVFYLT